MKKFILTLFLILIGNPAQATPPVCDPADRIPFYGNLVDQGGGWRIYDLDSEHAYYNIDSVTTVNASSTSGYVQVNHPCGTYIGTPGLQEDNAYAGANILYGASIDKCWFKITFAQGGTAISPNTAGAISNSNIPFDGWVCGPEVSPEEEAYSVSLNANEDVWDGYNLRVVIPASKITNVPANTPTYAKLLYNGCTTEPLTVSNETICNQAASGDAYDCAATPVSLGTNTAVPQSGTATSDPAAFAWDKTSAIVANFYFSGGSAHDCIRRLTTTGAGSMYYKVGSDETGTANVTGYSGSSSNPNTTGVFSKILMDGY